ncbi:MAG: polysaccharide deacetylase family protein [Vicingaceae bacterium]|nr:polysaccharide deacetylase family protein [Vicingaceae bacterium]
MIKNLAKNISKSAAQSFSLEGLVKRTDERLLLPFYHSVTDRKPLHLKNLYLPRSIDQFKADLDFLQKHYTSISLQDLIEFNGKKEGLTNNYFHMTFDDGLSEFYAVVAPILKERGIHATVFLNSDFIDNKELFYRFKASILFEELQDEELLKLKYAEVDVLDGLANEVDTSFRKYLENEQPYLTSDQIEELIEEGFTFGAHSKNHPMYKELSLKDQIKQTIESIEFVKTKFNLDYSVFSFPFTDDGVGMEFFNQINELTDLTFGCAGIKEDSAKNHIQRIPMETNQVGKDIIKAEYLYCLMKQKFGRNKIVRE